jgi:flavodoxin
MKDKLVVYFSRSGRCRRLAEEIAVTAGADLDVVREMRVRSGLFGYLRSAHEAWRQKIVDISPATKNPSRYSLVVLGSPVWVSNLSSPMRAYVTAHKHELTRVALFCTQRGSGADKVLQAMAELCERTPVATAFFNDGEIAQKLHGEKLRKFIHELTSSKAS